MTSIEVGYTVPIPSNGIIREYEVSFSITPDFKDFTHKSSADNSVTVSSLTPYTNYYIKVGCLSCDVEFRIVHILKAFLSPSFLGISGKIDFIDRFEPGPSPGCGETSVM